VVQNDSVSDRWIFHGSFVFRQCVWTVVSLPLFDFRSELVPAQVWLTVCLILTQTKARPAARDCIRSLAYRNALVPIQTPARLVEVSWNVMAHAQKPDFVFRRNGRAHLHRRGRQFSRLLAAEVCASAVVKLDTPCSEVVWRVLTTHLHSPVSSSLPLPCVTVCHHVSTGVYQSGRGEKLTSHLHQVKRQ